MEFEKLIEERRSIRSYTNEKPSKELIEKVLKEAQRAPSWKNSQTARVYAAYDEELLGKVREALPPFNQKNASNAVLLVTSFVTEISGFGDGVPTNDAGNCWGAYDLGLHDAFLILAAKDNGLDTLIMGIRDETKLREALNIPENEQIMSVIAIGCGDQNPPARPRKDLSEVAFIR